MVLHSIDIEYICGKCGEIVANGVGPSGMPTVTTILNKLPSSSIFYRDACQHDSDYHDQIGKKLSDNLFLARMKQSVWDKYPIVERKSWYSWLNPKRLLSATGTAFSFSKRRFFIAQAWRNYLFVKYTGEKAYKDGACSFMSVS